MVGAQATEVLPEGETNAAKARSESELLRALCEGRREAAEELFERTYPTIWAACFRFTGGDSELAADVAQETYRKAWAALARFDGRCQLSTWLYRIAYTTFLKHRRRPRLIVPLAEDVARAADPRPTPDLLVAADVDGEVVRRAVLELPEELRFAVLARFWGDIAVREIARQEGVSTVAIRKRLRRALRLLSKAIEER